MKILVMVITAGVIAAAAAKTIHRSFRNGYPVVPGVQTRTPSNVSAGSAVFKSLDLIRCVKILGNFTRMGRKTLFNFFKVA